MERSIAVLGAGGIGGSIGAYLTREGHDVTLVDQWAEHIQAMKHEGLTFTDVNQEFTVPVKALHLSEVSGLRRQFDIIFLSVKSYDTRWSVHLIEPHLKPSGFILPAMNCLPDETVAQIVGYNRTVGCVTTISAGVYDPGHIVRTDPTTTHAFTIGELSGIITPRVSEVVDALQVVGPSDATRNIWGARWSKLVWNCMGNALSGLLGPKAADLTREQRDLGDLVRIATGREAVRVAQRVGIALEPIQAIPPEELAEAATQDEIRALKAGLERAREERRLSPEQARGLSAPGRPSLLQDVIKGRRTEVDYLNGHIVSVGREVGVPTPMNAAILDLTYRLEAGEVEPGPDNLKRLEPHLGM